MKAKELYDELCPWCYRTEGHHPDCPEPHGEESPEMQAFFDGKHAGEANQPVPQRISPHFVPFFAFGYRFAQRAKQCKKNGVQILPDPPKKH